MNTTIVEVPVSRLPKKDISGAVLRGLNTSYVITLARLLLYGRPYAAPYLAGVLRSASLQIVIAAIYLRRRCRE